jgi:alkaline phosphatase D
MRRRHFLQSVGFATVGTIASQSLSGIAASLTPGSPGLIASDRMRPKMPYGIMSGDITGNQAVVWSKSDRVSRMVVEYSLDDQFRQVKRLVSEVTGEAQDFTARVVLPNLERDRPIFYRVMFQDPDQPKIQSESVTGRLQIPGSGKDIFFAWSGDTAGQGWGINPEFGGMKIYESMRKLKPDFFIHSGDTIYADGPIV